MISNILLNNQISAKDAVIMFLIGIIVFFVSLTLHEFAHGYAAFKMGDPTPKLKGRLTLNPFKHLDISGFVCFVFLGFGWAKPMPVNPLNFKKYRTGVRLVSIVGVATNLLLGLVSAGITAVLLATVGVPNQAMVYVYMLLFTFMLVNSFLAMYNILPFFPLDGYNFLASFMKTENKFIRFNIKNGYKMLMFIILISLFIELIFGIDILGWYLSVLYNYVFRPIALLGVM